MMKWFVVFIILSTSVLAGNEAGNGGVSIVCRDANERITKAELLDIFEGKELHGLKYSKDDLGVETIIDLVQLKLIKFPDFLLKFQEELAQIEKKIVFIREGIELNPTNDAFPVINLKGCGYEQLANFTNGGYLFVSKEIYDSLDVRNKAALYVHEAVYKLRRDMGDDNSINARLLTSHLMASNSKNDVIERLVTSSAVKPPGEQPPCGLVGKVNQRIASCNLMINGFALVSRISKDREVYKDLVTGNLWSSPFLQKSLDSTRQICNSKNIDLGNIPFLSWRLPSIKEFETADNNGLGVLIADRPYYRSNWLRYLEFTVWTSSKVENPPPRTQNGPIPATQYIYDFDAREAKAIKNPENWLKGVVCVGTEVSL